MSLELAKYLAMKWMEGELELAGHIANMSCSDAIAFKEWFDKEHPKYRKMADEIKQLAIKKHKL